MQFLFPTFFWALSLLAIPVIIHLLNFRRFKTIYFSHVGFLFNIQQEKKSRSTLRNLLILLMRLLAIAALVFAFTRPYIPNDNQKASPKTGIVVIYIDNSFSMEAEGKYGMLLEQAKLKAIEIADAFPPSTQFKLITNDFEIKHSNSVNKTQFKEMVSMVHVSGANRSLSDVVEHHREPSAQADTLKSEYLFILSDFQESTCFKDGLKPNNSNKYFIVPFTPQTTNNLSIDSLWFSTPGEYLNKLDELNISVTNHSEETYRNLPLNLFINEVQKTLVSFDIEPNQIKLVKIPFVQNKSGEIMSRVELSDYPVTFDNTFYFNYEIKQQISILEIYQHKPSPNLNALFARDSNFLFQSTSVFSLSTENIGQFDLVVLNGVIEISSGLKHTFEEYIYNGGDLFILPCREMNLESYNAFLNQCNGPMIAGYTLSKGTTKKLNTAHYLLNGALGNQDFSKIKLPDYNGYFPISFAHNRLSSVILETESGDPFYTVSYFGKGAISFIAVPINNESSNIATHPLTIPLFYNTALYSNENTQLFYIIKTGMAIKAEVPSDINANLEIKSLNGKFSTIPTKNISQGNLWLFPTPEILKSGHYDIVANGQHLSNISFNYNRIESKLKCLSGEEVVEQFKKAGIQNIQILENSNKTTAFDIEKLERGTDLTLIMLLAALLFVLAELLLLKL